MLRKGKNSDKGKSTSHPIQGNQWARKYRWNFDYFAKVDSEQKAYWLGFIAGDASFLNQKGHGIKFKLALGERDLDHLQRFADDIEFTGTPSRLDDGKGHTTWEFYLFGTKFNDDLSKLGMSIFGKEFRKVPRLDKTLRRHYWRGLFDADGSISRRISYTGTPNYFITVCHASLPLLSKFGLALSSRGICKGLPFAGHGTWQISTCGRQATQQLANWMYEGASRYLNRKASIFLDAFTNKSGNKQRSTPPPCLMPKPLMGSNSPD